MKIKLFTYVKSLVEPYKRFYTNTNRIQRNPLLKKYCQKPLLLNSRSFVFLKMIRLFAIGVMLSIGLPLQAQVLDSLKLNFTVQDTLYKKAFQTLDSVQNETIKSYGKIKHQFDSIEAHYNNVKSKVHHSIDSLSKLKLPTNRFTLRLDSLDQLKEERLTSLRNKIDSVKANTISKINQSKLPPEIQTKVSEYTSLLDKVDLSLPSSNLEIPSLDVGSQLNGLSIPDLKNPLGEGLPNVSMPSIPGTENIGQATEQLHSLQENIPKDVTSIDQLGKTAEIQLTQIDGVKGIQDQLGKAPLNPLTSEEETKKQLLSQAKEVAIDHFADKGEELKAAMDKISKYKQKYSSINSLSEITKRPPNPMKGKPFIERVVPGIQFQIQGKNGDLMVDFNGYLGYRFTGRLTSGLGWNQRVAYTKDANTFHPDARVFGPRAFGEFKLGKGFSPRIELETMNTVVPPFVVHQRGDIGKREWVFGAMVGIKKEYRFYKNIKGTTTIMLNLLNQLENKPYVDVVNARFGFEFPVKLNTK